MAKKRQTAVGATREQVCLTPDDRAALAYLKRRHGHASLADSMRYALRELARLASPSVSQEARLQRLTFCSREVAKAKGARKPAIVSYAKKWPLWMYREDFFHAARIGQKRELNRSEAMRLALRFRAEEEGFRPRRADW